MKQLKIIFILTGILHVFLLNGCVGGSGSSGSGSPTVGMADSQNSAAAGNSASVQPILTSLTLWATNGDPKTAIAGEIVTNMVDKHITIQLPTDMQPSAKLYITYTGTDLIMKVNADGSEEAVYNGSQYQFNLGTLKYVVAKGLALQTYTVSIIPRAPYFTQYANNCVKDFEGNIWTSNPYSGKAGTYYFGFWNGAVDYANKFQACGFNSGWQLPTKLQAEVLVNSAPAAYRSKQDGGPGNSAPIEWLKQQKSDSGDLLFQLPVWPGANYWLSNEDPDNKSNADLINIEDMYSASISFVSKTSLPYLAWPIHSGDMNDAKTITDFSVKNQVGNTLIAGNQIFITANAYPSDNNAVPFSFNSTGNTVRINGVEHISGDIITLFNPTTFPAQQIIPIAVTSINGDTNMYTLVLTRILPPDVPVTPDTFNICSSSDSADSSQQFNRRIYATIGESNEYEITLPPPGSCGPIKFGNQTSLQTVMALEKNPVLWWSVTEISSLAVTKYFDANGVYQDVIPTITWVPDKSDPSGYTITAEVREGCQRDSTNSSGFTDACTSAKNTATTNGTNSTKTATALPTSINFCSISTQGNSDVISAVNNFVQDAPSSGGPDPSKSVNSVNFTLDAHRDNSSSPFVISSPDTLPKINQCKTTTIFDPMDIGLAMYLSGGDSSKPLTLAFAGDKAKYFYHSIYTYAYSPKDQTIILINMAADMVYCQWILDWRGASVENFNWQLSLQNNGYISKVCKFPTK